MDTLVYNTQKKKLIIPEYGRHIHDMIDQAVALKDKEKRNEMAKAIIGVMGNLNPHLRDVPDFQHKLWAQLFIMSDFQLDVESPYDKPLKEVYENLLILNKIPKGNLKNYIIKKKFTQINNSSVYKYECDYIIYNLTNSKEYLKIEDLNNIICYLIENNYSIINNINSNINLPIFFYKN